MIVTNDHVIFYGGDEIYSNFYLKAPYTIHLIEFPTVEHGFQWEKCMFFNDLQAAKEILATRDPGEAKYIGKRKLKGFIEDEWAGASFRFMLLHLEAKFSQHAALGRELVDHVQAGRQFFEASKTDKIWGTGFYEKETRDILLEGGTCPGENKLGIAHDVVGRKLLVTNPWLQSGGRLEEITIIENQRKEEGEEEYD